MKKIISLVMTVLVALSMFGTTAFAATVSEYEPYGFSWYDTDNKIWHVQLYEFDARANAYRISDRVVVKDSLLYDMAGNLIVSDVSTYEEDKPTVVFDGEGNLYFTSKNGETRKMENSLDNTFAVCSTFKAKYFENDVEGLVKYARSATTRKTASSLVFTGNYMRHVDPVITDGYVKMYAVNGDPEKIGYDAYYNGNVVVTTYCKDSRVWVETVKLLISETSKGAKFVGYSAQYGIMLYDLSGSVLLYKYEDGFKKYSTLYKDIEVYYFTKDSKGFISGIVTSKGTYDVSTELKFPGSQSNNGNSSSDNTGSNAGSTGSVTSVKNFTSKSMAYNGDKFLGTLAVKNKKLYWKGTELKNSKGSSEFGISKSLTPFWVDEEDCLYYFDGSNSQLVATNVLRLKFDDDGRAIEFKASDGKWYKLW